uniref:Uncharacterized protein n=1 Tax=Leptospirillum ferrodiazotrophum TaxID=412449 RepID=C6HWQ3_9BACT|nr:MAG: hypothetical protein UBAL3_80630086 [Leptospirillum ferrodiazotrophum]
MSVFRGDFFKISSFDPDSGHSSSSCLRGGSATLFVSPRRFTRSVPVSFRKNKTLKIRYLDPPPRLPLAHLSCSLGHDRLIVRGDPLFQVEPKSS